MDVPAWLETLDSVETIDPDRLGVAHFGFHGDFVGRVEEMRRRLVDFRDRVAEAMASDDDADREAYETEVRERLSEFRPREEVDGYFNAFSAVGDWDGMKFYLERADR